MNEGYPFRRVGNRLVPSSPEAESAFRAIKDGRDVMVTFRASRNIRQHKLFFAILQFLKMHVEIFEHADTETIKAAVKIATGYVRTFIDTTTGKTAFVPMSIAFAAMDQTKFNEFFDNATKVIASRWMPAGSTADEVRRELIEMVDGPQAIGSRVA